MKQMTVAQLREKLAGFADHEPVFAYIVADPEPVTLHGHYEWPITDVGNASMAQLRGITLVCEPPVE
jgi:hypothetical protein